MDVCLGLQPRTVGYNFEYLIILRRNTLEGNIFSHPLPQMGPLMMEDLVGMNPIVLVLQKSLKLVI